MTNSQLLTAETALETLKNSKTQSDHRFYMLQQEKVSLETRNSEMLEVMKTLESGVEILQKEKLDLTLLNNELMKKSDAQDRTIDLLNEQITNLNERNSTLSKKCVDLLDGSKEIREKNSELEKLKPQLESYQRQAEEISEESRRQAMQIANYEVREQNWIKVKSDLEKRVLAEIDRADKAEQYIKHKLANAIDEAFKKSIGRRGEHIYLEQIQKLQQSFESLRSIQKANLNQTQEKLDALEKQLVSNDSDLKNVLGSVKNNTASVDSNSNNKRQEMLKSNRQGE